MDDDANHLKKKPEEGEKTKRYKSILDLYEIA